MAVTVQQLLSYLNMPPDPPAWEDDTAYDLGGVVTHEDHIWRSEADENEHEPGTVNSNWTNLGETAAVEAASYLASAISKARSSGVPNFSHNANYDMFIKNLAAMYRDNKGMAFSGSYQATAEATAKKMINGFVLELRHATEDPVEDDNEGGDDE